MNIEAIFEIVTDALASVKYESEPKNAFEYCFDLWDDVEYLEEFFETHKADLAGSFWGLTVEKAVVLALDEARQFKQDILDYATRGKTSDTEHLDNLIFVPLADYNHKNIRVPSKAYGLERGKSLLRLYAIRLGPNHYIVTGGTIKLTKGMDEREHTQRELQKLKQVSEYLKELGVVDDSDYGYIEFSKTD